MAGLLPHGLYLGGVFTGIDAGVPVGTTALIVGTQPVLTAVLVGPLLGERVPRISRLRARKPGPKPKHERSNGSAQGMVDSEFLL